VEQTALALYAQLLEGNTNLSNLEVHNELRWACRLHELGMVVSHSEFHRHGAYIVEKADAAGFSQSQQQRLAQLILGHRGGLRKVANWFEDKRFTLQLLALRLASILCHARRDTNAAAIKVSAETKSQTIRASLAFDPQWMKDHPQSLHLLREEVMIWDKLSLSITLLEEEDLLSL
jgi:exopolyphosphatase / guanosine-5'-triphosphate,3'-diphosphate pyrophosphatase